MPRETPVVLIFEQHSFSSGSETAEKLISEGWCNMAGFGLPRTWELAELKTHYEKQKAAAGFIDEATALKEFSTAIHFSDSDEGVRHILSIRSYLAALARLNLLKRIEKDEISAQGLDITEEERSGISGHITIGSDISRLLKAGLEAKVRRDCISDSIASVDETKSMVCILGIGHAHGIIERLRSRGILVIPCFIRDSWVPKEMESAINSSYPPEIREADGLLDFSSVDAAMARLRDILLPYSIGSSKRLDAPTSLTSKLMRSTHLPFFSIGSGGEISRVSAITEITKAEDIERAVSLQSKLGHGGFFNREGKCYFGLPAINMTGTNPLPEKILKLCP